MPITHTDGAEYFSKDEIESKIKDRVRGEQERYTTLEAQWKTVEPKLAQLTTLETERDTWREKASRVETRYVAATQYGITDQDTLEALEESHKKAMGRVPDAAQRVDFGAYLGQVKADPSLLPTYLRGVFAVATQEPVVAAASAAQNATQEQPAARPSWASASTGQRRVEPGTTPGFAEKVASAKTMEELAQLSAERRRR